jgi:hypothetical protein
MPLGPGKYDDVCVEACTKVGVTEQTGGGVVLIVLGGNKGNGFSCQADLKTALAMPEILEYVAKQMRESMDPL